MLFSGRLELAKKIDDYMEEKHIMQSTLGVVSVLQIWEMLAIPIEPPVKPACVQCCKNCNAYEMTKEEHLENFCSRYCIRMSKLFSWDVNKNYCDQFESKSV